MGLQTRPFNKTPAVENLYLWPVNLHRHSHLVPDLRCGAAVAKGVTIPVDKRPLPGSKKRKTRATPVAAAAVADTPVAAVAQRLDFTFENAWLARVTHGLSQQEVVDMLAGSLGPYARTKKAGVPFPDVPGGSDSLTMANFGGVVTALEALTDFAKWGHSGDKPDLPEG